MEGDREQYFAKAVAALAAVVDVAVVVSRDNPLAVSSSYCESAEGIAVVGRGSDTGLTAELLSGERAGREVDYYLGLGFGLGFGFGLGLGF